MKELWVEIMKVVKETLGEFYKTLFKKKVSYKETSSRREA